MGAARFDTLSNAVDVLMCARIARIKLLNLLFFRASAAVSSSLVGISVCGRGGGGQQPLAALMHDACKMRLVGPRVVAVLRARVSSLAVPT